LGLVTRLRAATHDDARRDRGVPILMYHSVARGATSQTQKWVVEPARFREQMALLAESGCEVVSLHELVTTRRTAEAPARRVAITFDDGYADFATEALPVLIAHRFPSTMFIPTGCVGMTTRELKTAGDARPLLDWTEIEQFDELVEIGAHAHSHAPLDVMPLARASEEIALSRTILTERLGRAPRLFSYPHGHYTRHVRALVRDAGYEAACTVEHRLSGASDDVFALSRVSVHGDIGLDDFEQLVRGSGLHVARGSQKLRTHVRRAIRRARATLPHRTAA
jgi:peptidoglycan/xylan/chitin deacetylase (PgdA/CDA1 family)